MLSFRSGIKTAIVGVVFTDFPAIKKESPAKIKDQKRLLISFFDNKGIINKEFIPAGQAINAEFYHEGLNRLLQRIRRDGPESQREGWIIDDDDHHHHFYFHGVRPLVGLFRSYIRLSSAVSSLDLLVIFSQLVCKTSEF